MKLNAGVQIQKRNKANTVPLFPLCRVFCSNEGGGGLAPTSQRKSPPKIRRKEFTHPPCEGTSSRADDTYCSEWKKRPRRFSVRDSCLLK